MPLNTFTRMRAYYLHTCNFAVRLTFVQRSAICYGSSLLVEHVQSHIVLIYLEKWNVISYDCDSLHIWLCHVVTRRALGEFGFFLLLVDKMWIGFKATANFMFYFLWVFDVTRPSTNFQLAFSSIFNGVLLPLVHWMSVTFDQKKTRRREKIFGILKKGVVAKMRLQPFFPEMNRWWALVISQCVRVCDLHGLARTTSVLTKIYFICSVSVRNIHTELIRRPSYA